MGKVHIFREGQTNLMISSSNFCDLLRIYELYSSGFFHFPVLTQTFIRVSKLRFTSYFNFSFNLFLSNCLCFSTRNFFRSSLAQQSRIYGFQIIFFLGFKTRVFNSQFLTQPDISFCRFPNFKHEKGYFLVYFNRPSALQL